MNTGPLAIVGMSCRFPGAPDSEHYWGLLRAGSVAIGEVPTARWSWQDYWGDPRTGSDRSNSRWGGFIDGVDAFDRRFFRMSQREADAIDPQQRLALELAWACFEDAGIRPSQLSGRNVGVFTGVMNVDYRDVIGSRGIVDSYHESGLQACVVPNRVSHWFNFTGPSVPLHTSCSSSLYALHFAAQSLRAGECGMALVGGFNLLLTGRSAVAAAQMGILSPTGSVRAFDHLADGTVLGEGGGFVLLKPLRTALDDGDRIIGLLLGSAINHDGRTSSLTYPAVGSQAAVIAQAHRNAGVEAGEVTYVEAHGTGTPKGDPIELEALTRVFETSVPSDSAANHRRCGVGAVKANIGHLAAAAGMASLIKALLSLRYESIVPTPRFERLNTAVDFRASGLYVADRLSAWEPATPRDGVPRRIAGVSAFGFSGTNAHVLIGGYEHAARRATFQAGQHIYDVVLSALTEEALRLRVSQLATWLAAEGDDRNLPSITRTLRVGREPMAVSLTCRVTSVAGLRSVLLEFLAGRVTAPNVWHGTAAPPAAVAPGADDDSTALMALPTYPFERTPCWVGPRAEAINRTQRQREMA